MDIIEFLNKNDFVGAYRALKESRQKSPKSETLADKFLAPPLNCLSRSAGYWRKLDEKWSKIDSGGRDAGLLGTGSLYAKNDNLDGTSRFSPVLCELVYKWFLPPDRQCKIYDPFCGGPERGYVAAALGHQYTGVDIRPEQIEHNRATVSGAKYFCADSTEFVAPDTFDMVFTCPPYFNMERYSDLAGDLSNSSDYNTFMDGLTLSLANAKSLTPEGMVILVVGDIRDRRGFIYPFVHDCECALRRMRLNLLNRVVINGNATAGARAERPFMNSRILTNTVQYMLVFSQGIKPPKWNFPSGLHGQDNVL